jgi:hypothetical protein
MNIQHIDDTQFRQISGIRQIIAHDHPRKFATIAFEHLDPLGVSWRSDLVEPLVVLSPNQTIVWLGIDQQLVAFDLNQDRISLALPLNSNVVQIISTAALTVVLTELEVLLFNSERSLRCIQGLPDIGTDLKLQGTTLTIHLLDGDSLTLDSQTGVFKSAFAWAAPR